MREIKIKVIILQAIGLILFSAGIIHLFVAFQSEKFIWINKMLHKPHLERSKSWTKLHSQFPTVSDFLDYLDYFIVGIIIFSFLLIAFINWKRKNPFFYTAMILFITIYLIKSQFFHLDIIAKCSNYIGWTLTHNLKVANSINGLIFLVISLYVILIKENSTTHNSA